MRGTGLPAISLHVGTYTDSSSQGIYRLGFDPETGALGEPALAAEAVNPAFLAWHPSLPVLYAVCETDTGPGRQGAVVAFAAALDGSLTALNEQSSGGAGPCHVSIAGGGTHLFVANYHGGSVAAFPLDSGGRIGSASSIVRHAGSSVDPVRQRKPYAHAMASAPDAPFALAADLGIDRVLVYRYDAERGVLTPHQAAAAAPGSGPRHLAFAPEGGVVFVINELNSTIASYAWDGARGTLTPRGEPVSTLPAGFTGTSTTAEIAVHPDGEFLYGSNRGHDSIAVFRIGSDQRLTWVGCHPTHGATPRHFAIEPAGAFLIAANQDSDSLVVFRVDRQTGLLSDTGGRARIPSPACVRLRPRPPIA